ncbi:MAG TPA: hypothetical protein VMW93_02255 [bacterium]|nr:hypothetical protein [bacterium]
MRTGLKFAVLICAFAGACSKAPPPREAAAAAPYAEDEFAARAAALQKTCELAVVYLGTDDARAAAVVEQGRREALEAVRRAPDPYRGVAFARAYERLDGATTTLAGIGVYSPPLSDATYERLRGELLTTADELRPLGYPYYLKVARRYEGLGRRRVTWGPMPPPAPGPAKPPGRALEPAASTPETSPPETSPAEETAPSPAPETSPPPE